MSDQEKVKRGCLGCAGLGCAIYIVLSLISLLFYVFVLDTPLDAVKKCTLRQIAGTPTMGGGPLGAFEKMGVDIDKKLRKAIAGKKSISDVGWKVADASQGMKLVAVTMSLKGATHGDETLDVGMAFLVKPKSLFNFGLTELIGLADITVKRNGQPRRLDLAEPSPGAGVEEAPGNGLMFLSALYSDDDANIAEFADRFIEMVAH